MLPSLHAGIAGDFVDAHALKGVTVEEAIEGMAQCMPLSMPVEELMLRRQIATLLLITMGRKITHFEGDIDPLTGTIDVDFKLAPRQA
jgi:hypothetical protein